MKIRVTKKRFKNDPVKSMWVKQLCLNVRNKNNKKRLFKGIDKILIKLNNKKLWK